jgi:hypothetical protein
MFNKPLIIALACCAWGAQAQNLPPQATPPVPPPGSAPNAAPASAATAAPNTASKPAPARPSTAPALKPGETKMTLPILVPSIGDVVENQRSKATSDYVKRLNIVDPDIDEGGKLKLPPTPPRAAFLVRYLHGDPGDLRAVVEYQGQLRQVRTGDKLMGFEVRVTRQGVSIFLTRKGRKQGWTDPLAPGLYQEYF